MVGNLAGQTIANRYDLLAMLGRGGMGEVYRAHDRELDELVALKVINPDRASDPEALAHFRSEVKLARRVTHLNIARTYELGTDRDIVYCTMELVVGESLLARLRQGRLPVGEAATIAHGLCEGLAAAHAAGVIHRDIKPGNVLLALDGRPMLVDFGVATVRAARSTMIAGTPGYMAPEVLRGEPASPASDLYAVGVVLFEMLSGKRAFAGASTAEVVAAQRVDALHLDSDVPRELGQLVARATAHDPDRRIGDAKELARALVRWVGGPATVTATLPAESFVLRDVIVLPPQGEESRMHVALGVHQAVVDELAKKPRLRVLPRLRVDQKADAVVELRVVDALEVRVVRPSGTLRLDLPLAAEDLRSVASAVAAAIASAIEEARALVDPQLAEATDLWLRARALMHRNLSTSSGAIEMLERAHALAPTDARISSTLANAYARTTFFQVDTDPSRLQQAAALIRDALRSSAGDVDVHNAAALLELNVGNALVAARHFRKAIACAPCSAEAHDGLGRMLVEAGYLEEGQARVTEALAIAPDLNAATWTIARMHALEGRWDECYHTVRAASPTAAPGQVYRLRFSLWRGDYAAIAAQRDRYIELVRPIQGEFAVGLMASLVDGKWLEWRSRVVESATATIANRRRSALFCQLAAELAMSAGDIQTGNMLIDRAVELGLYDLHWLERCPVLEGARGTPEFQRAHATVSRRAEAILDALYGEDIDEVASQLAPPTVLG